MHLIKVKARQLYINDRRKQSTLKNPSRIVTLSTTNPTVTFSAPEPATNLMNYGKPWRITFIYTVFKVSVPTSERAHKLNIFHLQEGNLDVSITKRATLIQPNTTQV